jgi:hypothetical protein
MGGIVTSWLDPAPTLMSTCLGQPLVPTKGANGKGVGAMPFDQGKPSERGLNWDLACRVLIFFG